MHNITWYMYTPCIFIFIHTSISSQWVWWLPRCVHVILGIFHVSNPMCRLGLPYVKEQQHLQSQLLNQIVSLQRCDPCFLSSRHDTMAPWHWQTVSEKKYWWPLNFRTTTINNYNMVVYIKKISLTTNKYQQWNHETSGSNLSFSSWKKKFVLKLKSLIVVFNPKIHGASSKVFRWLGCNGRWKGQLPPNPQLMWLTDTRRKKNKSKRNILGIERSLGRRRTKMVQFVHVFNMVISSACAFQIVMVFSLPSCCNNLRVYICSISRSSAERWHWKDGRNKSRNKALIHPLLTFPYPSSNATIENDMFVASLLALIHPPNIPDLSPSIPHRLRWRTCFTSVAIPCWRAQYGRRAAIITSPPRRKDENRRWAEREREWSKHMTSDERCPEYPLRGRMKKGWHL